MPLSKQLYKNGALTLFYADDDKDDALIFQEVIADIHPQIKVRTLYSGKELLELLSLLQPDMVFLDLEMPEMNGLECLVEIRKMEAYVNLPIVVYSSTTRLANIETAYEMGADLFFIKPYTYEELLSSLTTILRLDWSDPSKVKKQYLVNGRYVGFL